MNGRDQRDVDNDSDKIDDAVDPRVQVNTLITFNVM